MQIEKRLPGREKGGLPEILACAWCDKPVEFPHSTCVQDAFANALKKRYWNPEFIITAEKIAKQAQIDFASYYPQLYPLFKEYIKEKLSSTYAYSDPSIIAALSIFDRTVGRNSNPRLVDDAEIRSSFETVLHTALRSGFLISVKRLMNAFHVDPLEYTSIAAHNLIAYIETHRSSVHARDIRECIDFFQIPQELYLPMIVKNIEAYLRENNLHEIECLIKEYAVPEDIVIPLIREYITVETRRSLSVNPKDFEKKFNLQLSDIVSQEAKECVLRSISKVIAREYLDDPVYIFKLVRNFDISSRVVADMYLSRHPHVKCEHSTMLLECTQCAMEQQQYAFEDPRLPKIQANVIIERIKPEERTLMKEAAQRMVEYIEKNNFHDVIFLDFSARPIADIVRFAWTQQKKKPFPKIHFLNVGKEKTVFSLETILNTAPSMVLKAYAEMKAPVLVVDEVNETGMSLNTAKKIVEQLTGLDRDDIQGKYFITMDDIGEAMEKYVFDEKTGSGSFRALMTTAWRDVNKPNSFQPFPIINSENPTDLLLLADTPRSTQPPQVREQKMMKQVFYRTFKRLLLDAVFTANEQV